MNKRVQNRHRKPTWSAVIGAVSLLASLVAAGIEYRIWEASGEPYHSTPLWIVAWHYISLLVIVLSILLLIWQFLLLKLQKK